MDWIAAQVQSVLALDGLGWLIAAVLAAGLVRGFSGFGSAMIFMPIASAVLSPVQAIVVLAITEFFGPLPNLPAAWRTGAPREVGRMMLGALIGLPLGVAILSQLDGAVFGWVVSGVVLILLPMLMSGWRYHGAMTPPLVVGTGSIGGFLAGSTGLAGPPVIMLYMASALPAATIRANFLLYLVCIDVAMVGVFLAMDLFEVSAVVIGLLLAGPYMLANVAGALLFDPRRERTYRAFAYLVIAASAILGLPLFH